LSTLAHLTVNVIDRNDNTPAFTESLYNVSVFENNAVNIVIATVRAVDFDSHANGQLVYSLVNPLVSPYVYLNESTGEISGKQLFDHEKLTVLEFVVQVTDNGSPALHAICRVVINILDVNDERPRFSQSAYAFKTYENNRTGTSVVGQLAATDADSFPYNRFSFAIIDNKDTAAAFVSERFRLDPVTGVITMLVSLDREDIRMYVIRIRVTDDDDAMLSSFAVVTVDVIDFNDNAPKVTFPNLDANHFNISTSVPVGFVVFKVRATDADDDANARLSFTCNEVSDAGDVEYFEMDNSTGEVAVARSLESFTSIEFRLQVVVSDNGSPSLSTVVEIFVFADAAFAVELAGNTGIAETKLWIVNNRMIVIIVVCVSVVVVVILLIAIICLKVCGRRSRGQMYRCRPKDEQIVHLGQQVPYQRHAVASGVKVLSTATTGNTYTGSETAGRDLKRLQMMTAGSGATGKACEVIDWNLTNRCEVSL